MRAESANFGFLKPHGARLGLLVGQEENFNTLLGDIRRSGAVPARVMDLSVIAEDWSTVGPLLGGGASLTEKDGRPRIGEALRPGSLENAEVRVRAFEWLATLTALGALGWVVWWLIDREGAMRSLREAEQAQAIRKQQAGVASTKARARR